MSIDPLFERVGYRHFTDVISAAEVDRLRSLSGSEDGPGVRLGVAALAPVADLVSRDGPVGRIAATLLDRPAFAVRAILFDKEAGANWSLDWHQDRTIAVAERIETPGFGPWTVKQGVVHVQPPQSILEAMTTLRIHLDDVPIDNAPLRVLSGSHRLGRLTKNGIEQLIPRSEMIECLAACGDVWAYRTAIVHASGTAGTRVGSRRVLQIDYANRALPSPLRWALTP